jgi:hypothetical protein
MNWRKFQCYLEIEYGRLIALSNQLRDSGDHVQSRSTAERASIALMLARAVDAGLE